MGSEIIQYSIIISASLSLASCSLLLIAILALKDFTSLSYKLITYLCITDMITSIAFLLPSESYTLCILQAYLINFSILSSILFTSVILHFLHWCIVLQRSQSIKLECFYLIYAWLFPLLFSIIPIFTKSYHQSTSWCWIKDEKTFVNIFLQLIEGFGVAIIVIFYNVSCLIKINKKLKRELNDGNEDKIRKRLMNRMIFYPVVLVVCILPAILYRLWSYSRLENKKVDWVLNMIAADFQCLIGLGNCVVYGFTDNLKKRIKRKFKMLIDFEDSANV